MEGDSFNQFVLSVKHPQNKLDLTLPSFKKNRSNFSQIFLRWIDIHAVITLQRIWEESHTHSTRLDLDKSMASGFPQDH